MDMEIEDDIINLFSKSGLSETNDYLKIQNLIKTYKLTAQILHDEWELYCLNNRINSNHSASLGKFGLHVKKNITQLKKRLGNETETDQNLKKVLHKNEERELDQMFEGLDDIPDMPMYDNIDQSNNNNNNRNNGGGGSEEDFEFDFQNDTFNGISSRISGSDRQQARKAIKFAGPKAASFNFDKRTGADEIVQEYVGESLKDVAPAQPQKTIPKIIEMSPLSKSESSSGSGSGNNQQFYPTQYMSETLESRTKSLGESVKKYYNQFEVPFDVNQNADPSNEILRAVGRVWMSKTGIPLTQSFRLLGNDQASLSTFSILNREEPIFTGQVVMVEGKRIPGQHFGCSKIYYPKQLEFLNQRSKKDSSCYIIVASGPFSEYENTQYHPFKELCKVIENKKPNIVILNGPFIDDLNEKIQYLDQTFEDLFKDDMIKRLSSISSTTQFIIVPSLRDVHHDYVYPQPPFSIRPKSYDNIHFVTNPSTLLIDNSFTIGLSNSNIIHHLELRLAQGKNNISTNTVCEKIIEQQCYYPLHPAEVPIDTQYINSINFPSVTPDILIFGNTEQPFVNNTNDVLCLGTGQLMYHNGKIGTYSELIVSPGDDHVSKRSKVMMRKI